MELPIRGIFRSWTGPLVLAGLILSTAAWGADSPLRVRAVWISPQSFATKSAADEMIQRCAQAGFNVLVPDVMVDQRIYFRSTHFPGVVEANDEYDPLAYITEQAHAQGMKVEAWVCAYYVGSPHREPALHPKWHVLSLSGQPFSQQRFLSPSHPPVNSYLLAVFKDLLHYDIDGIHLDYIRYPGTSFDYSVVGRRAFKRDAGFDPLDFLDRADRLVKEADEPYPIRVLYPQDHIQKPWETTYIERSLDQTGIGFAFVSESPEQISQLRSPGLLIMSSYYEPSTEMIAALTDYVARGGDLFWTDAPNSALKTSEPLQQLLGVQRSVWTGEIRVALQPVTAHPMAEVLSDQPFLTLSSTQLESPDDLVAARLADGTPAIIAKEAGGWTVLSGPHLMKNRSPQAARTVKAIVEWLQRKAGVSGSNPLAAKRAVWVAWRADRVTQLVRAIHEAAHQSERKIEISSSGGPAPSEFYSCYRDARRWLAEGINDHVFPMNYTENLVELEDILTEQTAAAPPGKKAVIYPGLRAYTEKRIEGRLQTQPQDARNVERQIEIVREHGYEGFAIFAYDTLSDESLEAIRRASQAPE